MIQFGDWIQVGRYWLNIHTGRLRPILQGGTAAGYDQDTFQGRDDDVVLNSTTFNGGGGLGGDWSQATDTNFRIRFLLQETAGGMAANDIFELWINPNGTGYVEMTATTALQPASSGQYSDGATTSQVIGGGTYTSGESVGGVSNNTDTGNIDMSAGDEVELEWCLTIDSAQVNDGDTFLVQVRFSGGGSLTSYTDTPLITVSKPAVISLNTLSLVSSLQNLFYGIEAFTGIFNTGTGAVSSTTAVTGLGFKPKVLIFHWNGRTESVDAVGRQTMDIGWGFAVGAGTGNNTSATIRSVDNVSTTTGSSYITDANCISVGDDTGAIGLMALQSFDNDGFTLVVNDVMPADLRVSFLALGGSGISNAATGGHLLSGSTGDDSITSLSFQGDFAFFVGSVLNALPASAGDRSAICFGVAKSSTEQGVIAIASDDGVTPSDTSSYGYDGECVAIPNPASVGSLQSRAAFKSFDANGYTLDVLEGLARQLIYLVIKGGKWTVSEITTQTDTVTPITISGLDHTPKAGMVVSVNKAKSTQDTPTAELSVSHGVFHSSSERQSHISIDEDGKATTEVSTAVEHDEVYGNIERISSTIQGLMDVQSVNGDGVTFIMDDADPSASYAFVVTVGSEQIVFPDSLTLAGSAEAITIAVGAGAQSVVLTALALAGSAEALTLVPGAVSQLLDSLTLLSSAEQLSVIAGTVSVLVSALSLAGSAEQISVIGGAVTQLLTALTLVGSAEGLTVSPGTVSILLDVLNLVSSAEALVDITTSISILMSVLNLTGSAEGLTVSPGAVSQILSTLSLAGSVEQVSVVAGVVSVVLNALSLAGSAEQISIAVGAVSQILSVLTLAGTAEGLTVSPGTVSELMSTLTLTSSAEAITITVGALSILLSTLSLAGSAEALTVVPGAISILLDILTLSSSAEVSTIISGLTVLINALTGTFSAEGLTIVPGTVSSLLSTLNLAGSAEGIVIQSIVSILLNSLTLVGSAEGITISVADIISLASLVLSSSPQALTIVPGAVSLSLNTLTLSSSALALAIILVATASVVGNVELSELQDILTLMDLGDT